MAERRGSTACANTRCHCRLLSQAVSDGPEIDERRLKHRYSRVSDPGGLEPHLGGLAQSASVLHERRSLQNVSGDIATLLQPHGAGAAEMNSDQHARERVLARSIVHAVV